MSGTLHPEFSARADALLALSHPRGFVPPPLEMYPHGRHSSLSERRRYARFLSPFAAKLYLTRGPLVLGVSLITQVFYAIVFCTRYLDLFSDLPWVAIKKNAWNFFFRIIYITSSFYILFLMTRVFARTREREVAWKMGAYLFGASIVLAPILALIFPDEERSFHVNCPFKALTLGQLTHLH
jgi:hypothetical protein